MQEQTTEVQEIVQPQETQTEQTAEVTPQDTTATETTETTPVVEDTLPEFHPPQREQPKAEEDLTPEKVAEKFKGDKQALLKAFGFNDYIIGALDYYEKAGDLTPYLEAKSVDFTKLSDEQVIERKLREQYASIGYSEEELKLLIEDEMASRYKQDTEAYSERENQLGKLRLKADATEGRKAFIERQSQFKAPEVQREEVAQPDPVKQIQEAYKAYSQTPDVQKFMQEKKLQFGDYNYEVPNPQEAIATIVDPQRWNHYVSKLTPQEQMKLSVYVQNMAEIEKLIIEHGRTLGKKDIIDESENIVDNKSQGATAEADSFWKSWAKNARATQ
jgi:hypothetical protein